MANGLMADSAPVRRAAQAALNVEMAHEMMKEVHWGKRFSNGDSHIVHYRTVWEILTKEMKIHDPHTQIVTVLQGTIDDGGGMFSARPLDDSWFAGRIIGFGIEMLTKGTWETKAGQKKVNVQMLMKGLWEKVVYKAMPTKEYFERIANLETIALERGFSASEAKAANDCVRSALCAKRVAVLRRIHTWDQSRQRAYLGLTSILLGILKPCCGSDLLEAEYQKHVVNIVPH